MSSGKEPPTPNRRTARRPVVVVENEELRDRLQVLLGAQQVDFQVVAPGEDPLGARSGPPADLLVLRQESVQPEDLQRLNRYADQARNPDLVVLTEGADDLDRARLLSAGVSNVLESQDPVDELREAVRAIAAADRGSHLDPHAGRADGEPRLADFHSRSPLMRSFLELVDRVVETDSSLLLTGETGVGKERLAQAIHNEGARRDGPFVSVNCGAIPETLLESELFGHESGAFTGAEGEKKGRFELADGGTIFLDEIGEMPLHLQVALLTVLQRHSVRRIGGEELRRVDVRVMAATNRDLLREIRERRFREDLYFRLNVVELCIPPLRARREDVPDLAGSFIRHFRTALGRRQVEGITEAALDKLIAHPWPGNVRELINAIEHAIVMCRDRQIGLEDLPRSLREGPAAAALARPPAATDAAASGGAAAAGMVDAGTGDAAGADAGGEPLPLREAREALLRDFERDYFDALLRRTGGRVGRTAELAGITPRSLYDKLKAHGLRKEDYR